MNTKRIQLLLLLLTIIVTLVSGASIPLTTALAKNHLTEVNPEWKYYNEYLSSLDCQYLAFQTEADRIQFHFKHVITLLSQKDISHLGLSQKFNRKKVLNHLKEYGNKKIFPINFTVPKRNPRFIDKNNTHCAVAYLLDKTHDSDIINYIIQHHNDDFIRDMKSIDLLTWANDHGFTLDELGLIQPSYPSTEYVWNVWGSGQGIEGRINVMKTAPDDAFMVVAGAFSSIDGQDAQNIIGYNESGWFSLGELNGIIKDIAIDESNQIYAAGELFIENQKVNIASFIDGNWTALSNQANGKIHTIQLHNDKLFVGGEFTLIDSISCSNLAYYDLMTNRWNIDGENGNDGVFSTNGIVRDMDVTLFDSLVIGGSFSRTGILSNVDSINQDTCYNLSFWNGNDWEHKYSYENIPEVHCLGTYNGLHVGGDMNNEYSLAYRYFIDDWEDVNNLNNLRFTYSEEPIIQGFIRNRAYGNILPDDFAFGELSLNLVLNRYSTGSGRGINQTDGTITAVAEFQGFTYYAGTFTHMEDVQTNGLAKTDGTLDNKKIPSLELEISNSFNNLSITGSLKEVSQLTILNNSGQSVLREGLSSNLTEHHISLSSLSNGVYYVYVQNNNGRYTQKIVVVN